MRKKPTPRARTAKEILNDDAGFLGTQPGKKIKGEVRKRVLRGILDGESYYEIARQVQEFCGIKVSATAVRKWAKRREPLLAQVAEAELKVELKRGLSRKAKRLEALTAHYRQVCEMIEQHRAPQKRGEKPMWAILPSLSSLLTERRRTIEAIQKEVQVATVVDHRVRGTLEHVTPDESKRAAEEVGDIVDQLPKDVAEELARALAKSNGDAEKKTR